MKYEANTGVVYRAPEMKVVEIEVRSNLCGSLDGRGAAGIEGIDGEDNLDW
ncbi:MAG: hypothetical protein MJY84_03415 [Bacteroidales bacterium]|nr:hypothetical protein [Bacteroidales bacterium]